MDGHRLLLYSVLSAGVLALWFAFKVVKKVAFVVLVVVAIIGIILGLHFNLF